jgi:hypothetical protein
MQQTAQMSFDFVLERDLNFEIEGKFSQGKLRVGGIERNPAADGDALWICYWSLDEIHPARGKIYGVDPLDAFLNCTQFLKSLIERHKAIGYRVWWNEVGDDGGLTEPVEQQ